MGGRSCKTAHVHGVRCRKETYRATTVEVATTIEAAAADEASAKAGTKRCVAGAEATDDPGNSSLSVAAPNMLPYVGAYAALSAIDTIVLCSTDPSSIIIIIIVVIVVVVVVVVVVIVVVIRYCALRI